MTSQHSGLRELDVLLSGGVAEGVDHERVKSDDQERPRQYGEKIQKKAKPEEHHYPGEEDQGTDDQVDPAPGVKIATAEHALDHDAPPPSSRPASMATTVTNGISELRKAWRRIIWRRGTPLARAART